MWLVLAAGWSCAPDAPGSGFGWSAEEKSVDLDGDGYDDGADCDDADAAVNPGVAESCNAGDDDCDGEVDEGACGACGAVTDGGRTWLFCASGATWEAAEATCAGYGYHLADVDDASGDAWLFAEAQATAAGNWWFGLNDRVVEGDWAWDGESDSPYTNWRSGEPNDFGGNEDCAWYAETGGGAWNDKDCTTSGYYICQTGCVSAERYADADGDGFGDAAVTARVCEGEAGWVAEATDCDDTEGTTFPGAAEVADGVDQDCDGRIDCTWYADADGDAWGDDAVTTEDCAGAPAGFVAEGGDCDDGDGAANPGATDTPYDGVDADCSGGSDDDADGDGSDGNGGPDCDDAAASTYPGAPEACDAVDQDCDGTLDLGAPCPGEVSIYGDHSYFFATATLSWDDAQAACAGYGYHLVDVANAAEEGWIWAEAEAADPSASWWHGANDQATEGVFIWDGGSPSAYTNWRAGEPNDFGGNEDCAAFADDGGGAWNDRDCANPYLYVCEVGCERVDSYADADGDGAGNVATYLSECEVPAGYVADATDCDDADAAVFVGAVETCDGVDNDCDGLIDDADPGVDPGTFASWYADHDGDGDGVPTDTILACAPPPGWAPTGTDCDDENPAIYAGAPDPVDGVDADCAGDDEDWDSDGDGVWDTVERRVGLDPADDDSDDDGLADGAELDDAGALRDTDSDGLPDALDPDDDGDSLPTADEIGPDGALDTDADGTPDHLDLDSDNDGSADQDEAGRDSDHDGIPNAQEADDDGDGRLSLEEDAGDPDIDGDGVPNSLDQDSDGDGCRDADEPAGGWANAALGCGEDSGVAEADDTSAGGNSPPDGCACGRAEGGLGALAFATAAAALRRRRVSNGAAAR